MTCNYYFNQNHFYAQKGTFYHNISPDDPMETASTTDCRCLPSSRRNRQHPFATSATTTTLDSPPLHAPVSSHFSSQHCRLLHHRRRHRSSKSISLSTAAKRAERAASYNAYAVVTAAASAATTAPSNYTTSPCSPDSASLAHLSLLTTVSSTLLKNLPSSSCAGDLSLRPFLPEAVAALLVVTQQLQLLSTSSPTASRTSTALPSSAFGGKSDLHIHPVMLLDVRTFVRHSTSRIRSAVNFCIPDHLLEQSSFTIDNIRDTLLSKRARTLLRNWPSYANIIIYDANSITVHDASIIIQVFRKFRQENCTAEMGWLYGGFDNFSRKYAELCEPSSPLYDPKSSKVRSSSSMSNLSCEELTSQSFPRIKEEESQPLKRKLSLCLPTNRLEISTGPVTFSTSMTRGSDHGRGPNPFLESLGRNNGHGGAQTASVTEKSPHTMTSGETVAIRLPPCFTEDVEESEESSAAKKACSFNQTEPMDSASILWSKFESGGHHQRESKIAAEHPDSPGARFRKNLETQMNAHHVPNFLKELTIGRDAEQKLAKIFQTIEKVEQQRLRSLILHHARYPSTKHPFNISAGVELGEKNRYVNIWPYDYNRVRLRTPTGGAHEGGNHSDYINASFIKAPNCEQTYIATQGPLPATFDDFWNIVWYKDVKIIVMLTREMEGGRVKCHRYWPDENDTPLNYGPSVTVELLSKDTLPEADGSIIRRHFRMRYVPTGATRILVQLQYVGWPDFGVPDTPLAVLQLRAAVLAGPRIHEESIEEKIQFPHDRPPPILVHCSAGCGRTGAFCTIDSTLRLLEKPDGPFGCLSKAAIANDIILAKQEAEVEARKLEETEREEAKQPFQLSAMSGGSFSVAAALRPDPTPDTFCLKMPKFLKGKRRVGVEGQSEGSQTAATHDLAEKLKNEFKSRPVDAQPSLSSATTSECKFKNSHPPTAPSSVQVLHKLGPPPAQLKPLPYPNLFASAESRSTRDVVRGCVEVFREQRLNMVQSLRQFVFCYEAVLWQLMGAVNPPKVDACCTSNADPQETNQIVNPDDDRNAKRTCTANVGVVCETLEL